MIKLTAKEHDILDIMKDGEFGTMIFSEFDEYRGILEGLLEKGYIIKKKGMYKLNVEGKWLN